MAVYKDLELPNSRIWLAEIDIERSLDLVRSRSRTVTFCGKKRQTKVQIYWLSSSENIYLWKCVPESKEDERI